jgi:hypothetical protein
MLQQLVNLLFAIKLTSVILQGSNIFFNFFSQTDRVTTVATTSKF